MTVIALDQPPVIDRDALLFVVEGGTRLAACCRVATVTVPCETCGGTGVYMPGYRSWCCNGAGHVPIARVTVDEVLPIIDQRDHYSSAPQRGDAAVIHDGGVVLIWREEQATYEPVALPPGDHVGRYLVIATDVASSEAS